MDFIDAVKRPYPRGREFLFFFLFSMIPIANFFSQGYALRAASTAMKRKPLESWSDWGLYFKWGFFDLVIKLVYAVPVVLFLTLAVICAVVLGVTSGGVSVIIALLVLVPLFFLLVLFVGYLGGAATMAFVETGRLGSAFEFGKVSRRAFSSTFAIGWLQAVMVGMGYGMALMPFVLIIFALEALTGAALSAVDLQIISDISFTLLRIPLFAIISYPVAITQMTLMGEAYSKTR